MYRDKSEGFEEGKRINPHKNHHVVHITYIQDPKLTKLKLKNSPISWVICTNNARIYLYYSFLSLYSLHA